MDRNENYDEFDSRHKSMTFSNEFAIKSNVPVLWYPWKFMDYQCNRVTVGKYNLGSIQGLKSTKWIQQVQLARISHKVCSFKPWLSSQMSADSPYLQSCPLRSLLRCLSRRESQFDCKHKNTLTKKTTKHWKLYQSLNVLNNSFYFRIWLKFNLKYNLIYI